MSFSDEQRRNDLLVSQRIALQKNTDAVKAQARDYRRMAEAQEEANEIALNQERRSRMLEISNLELRLAELYICIENVRNGSLNEKRIEELEALAESVKKKIKSIENELGINDEPIIESEKKEFRPLLHLLEWAARTFEGYTDEEEPIMKKEL